MSMLITYQSKTGFTKKYAEWISEELDCELKELSKVSAADIKDCDLVIHGGWIMAGMISGLSKIKSFCPKKLIVFGVGLTAKDQLDTPALVSANKLGDTPCFYYEGGIDPKKMGIIGRAIIKMVTKKAPEYVDRSDKNEIEELVKLALSGTSD